MKMTVIESLRVLLFGAAVASAEVYQANIHHADAGPPLDGYVSYSIEFSSFPDFAGNKSRPNVFSNNLLKNLGDLQGVKPYIRVGGNTQDYALYDASQGVAIIGIIDPDRSEDYPTTITIGPSYFESYNTWPDVKFSHGLNMGLGGNRSEGWQTLVNTGPVRPSTWDEEEYVWQWHNATREIRKQVQEHCPRDAAHGQPKFMAPSFAGTSNTLNATIAFEDGLVKHKDIEYFSTHNYISGAESPGVTLQGSLMNHTNTMASVDAHIVEYDRIVRELRGHDVPDLIFGETNSLYNQGRPGLSNTFGAALWVVDFNLYSASVGFKRVHMHQGTNYRYQAWQPVSTDVDSVGTKAPYYGSIAVAAMIGNVDEDPVSISSIALSKDSRESAYAAHHLAEHGNLARILAINMRSYNTTLDGAGLDPVPNPPKRSTQKYTFAVPGAREGSQVSVQRLMANGSDAITGITFDGWSYNWELDEGKPVRLHNVTIGEKTIVRHGKVSVEVPDSSAVLLRF